MFVSFKNTKIFYSSKGTGNPLILLHGFLESSAVWKDLTKEFSRKRQIICIDLPGHGKSGCLGDVHTMEEMAEAVKQVLEELGIQKGDFIGHSMGGYVLLALMEKYPKMIKNLILLNSTPTADSEERKINRDRSVALVEKNKEAFVSMSISNLLSVENKERFREEIDEMKEDAKNFPTKGITAALRGMKVRPDRTIALKSFRGNKFFLEGMHDPIIDQEEISAAAIESDARLLFFSGGHLGFLENQKEFFEFVYFIE